jgi:hypothetical protein
VKETAMSTSLLAAVILGVVIYSVYIQVRGQAVQWARMALLPAGLVLFGFAEMVHVPGIGPADIACIAASAAAAVAIGLGQGAQMRLEDRNGSLWAKLPVRGLWFWAALIASRIAIMFVAHAIGAEAAASFDSIIFVLGLNRLAQAGTVAGRAAKAGLPVAA